jgi:hypothetical protein
VSLSSEPIPFQLLITRHNAADILAVASGHEWTLPEVSIHPQRRFAEQLTGQIKNIWGIDTYCLSMPALPVGCESGQVRHAIMELADGTDLLPPGACWMPRAGMSAQRNGLSEPLLHSLSETGDAESKGPFSKPGWMSKLRSWAETRLEPLGLQLSCRFRQLNAGESFSLIRFETQREAVWFKATGGPNKHELPLTAFLSSHFPGCVPTVLAIHHDWNGWLSLEVAGQSLGEATGLWAWEETAKALAELQIASIGKTDALLGAQARDHRLPKLVCLVDPFLARMEELMLRQEKPSPSPLGAVELGMLGVSLKNACESLASFRLENTINHSDLNPNNVLIAKQGCVFLDWAEGCIGNPLLTFEYLRQFLGRSGTHAGTALDRLANAYLRPWASLYSREELRRALTVAPLIAIFAYAVATDVWRSADPAVQPAVAGCLRSLVRRMYRESIALEQGSAACGT